MERAALLHNMSAPSRTTISHKAPRQTSRWISFHLPAGAWSAPTILARLDGIAWPGTADAAERELRRRLNRHAATLPIPAAVLLFGRRPAASERVPELLTICTVLAKSSERVYLRDKEPNLANLRGGRTVVLQLPCEGDA